MNRHASRKARKFGASTRHTNDGKQVWLIELIDPKALLTNSELFLAAMNWGIQISARRPTCILCDHSWLSLNQMPGPAAFVFIRPWRQSSLDNCIAGAVCTDCIKLPDLKQRCIHAATTILPEGRLLVAPHPVPEAVQ
jgi:hypothetical protein